MSTSVSPRPLSLIPFLAADAALLLTAVLIAWRTPEEIAGWSLFAITVCMVLGAVLAVLPFVLNDARERDAAQAERQRELVELVNTSTSSASRWGTQWAAAATGLEDAAGLASRSLAVAEQLPVIFQEKADALAEQLAQAGRDAQVRAEKGGQKEAALVAQMAQAEREAAARLESGARQEAALAARAEQMGATVAEFQKTLAEFGRVEAGLREQRAAIAAALAEFPAAAEQAKTARVELEQRVAEIPAQAEAHVAQVAQAAGEAEARLGATTEALSRRLAEVETMIGELVAKLERVAAMPEPAPVPVVVSAPAMVVAEPVAAKAPEVAPIPAVAPTVGKPKVAVNSEAIMDPFLIPDDGYASLAEAMDARNA
jgi:hypothetical protein